MSGETPQHVAFALEHTPYVDAVADLIARMWIVSGSRVVIGKGEVASDTEDLAECSFSFS
jgi:hypothetical protein